MGYSRRENGKGKFQWTQRNARGDRLDLGKIDNERISTAGPRSQIVTWEFFEKFELFFFL